jgi:hypothetical protein
MSILWLDYALRDHRWVVDFGLVYIYPLHLYHIANKNELQVSERA